MTQHEYFFIAISIILGLAITRLLHTMALITRAYSKVVFHWSSLVWALCIMLFILQFWWIGWGLRVIDEWSFTDFIVLVFGSASLYGAAEMALTAPEDGSHNMLKNSMTLGRLSALSLLLYFLVGPYVNIFLYSNPVIPSLIVPAIGILLMILVIALPSQFRVWSSTFLLYSLAVLYLTI